MLVKSHRLIVSNDPASVIEEFGRCMPGIVLCSNAFEKMEFLDIMINSTTYPTVFVDTDLLYTGYVKSQIMHKKDDVMVFRPGLRDLAEEFGEIIMASCRTRTLVIIDTLNGMHTIFDNYAEPGRLINSCTMLLASLCRQTGSPIIAAAMARFDDDQKWILTPGGRRVIQSSQTGCYRLEKIDGALQLEHIRSDQHITPL